MQHEQYVTYRDKRGTLRGGYILSIYDKSMLTDADIEKLILRHVDPLPVRRLNMNQLQVDLYEACVRGGISSLKHPSAKGMLMDVLIRHFSSLTSN